MLKSLLYQDIQPCYIAHQLASHQGFDFLVQVGSRLTRCHLISTEETHTALACRMAKVDALTNPDPEMGWEAGGLGERQKEGRSNRQIIHEEMMEKEESGGCFKCCLVFTTILFIIIFFPLVVVKCIVVVQEYERAIIFRFGRVKKAKVVNPGIYFVNPCLETVVKVDLRTRSFDVPPQEILTKDSVTVNVDAVVYYNIHDTLASVINVENADKSTKQISATTLRSILGTKTLQEILSDREKIGEAIYGQVKEATDAWGVQVERV